MTLPSFTIAGIKFVSPYVTENLLYVAKFPSSEPVWLVSLAVYVKHGSWTWGIDTWGPSRVHPWESGDPFSTKEEAAMSGLERLSGVLYSAHKEIDDARDE